MEYLLAGSFAYDTILGHNGHFHEKIIPESLKKLNVSFFMDNVENEFGGTAGNIAYNAALFKQKPMLIGSLGTDGIDYKNHLLSHDLDTSTLTYSEKDKTPHCWLMTDNINNQIMGFYVGAMKNKPVVPKETPELWHLCAENAFNIATLAKRAKQENKKYFFDPGQALPYFNEENIEKTFSLSDILTNAAGIFLNEYESELLETMTNTKLTDWVNENVFVVKTLGSKGVELYTKDKLIKVGVAKPQKIVDPTGCGDAFRAGFIYGYTHQYSLEDCVKLGSTMGSFAIENHGGQNHAPSLEEIFERYERDF